MRLMCVCDQHCYNCIDNAPMLPTLIIINAEGAFQEPEESTSSWEGQSHCGQTVEVLYLFLHSMKNPCLHTLNFSRTKNMAFHTKRLTRN